MEGNLAPLLPVQRESEASGRGRYDRDSTANVQEGVESWESEKSRSRRVEAAA